MLPEEGGGESVDAGLRSVERIVRFGENEGLLSTGWIRLGDDQNFSGTSLPDQRSFVRPDDPCEECVMLSLWLRRSASSHSRVVWRREDGVLKPLPL